MNGPVHGSLIKNSQIGRTAVLKITFFFFLRTAEYLKVSDNSNYIKILKSVGSDVFTLLYIRFEEGH